MSDKHQGFKYFDIILGIFVAILIISNIAAVKTVQIWRFTFDGGTILFPLSYIFGDILTEVYGYKRARRVIWTGFAGALLMSLVLYVVQILPASSDWEWQTEYETVLGPVFRIVLGSLTAYFAGEFSNSYILSRLKIKMEGKHLWVRTIGSTLVGEGIDTILFVLIAFYGVFDNSVLVAIIISNYIFKCAIEILFTPVTYVFVGFLKKKEHEDHYDKGISYNPFSMKL